MISWISLIKGFILMPVAHTQAPYGMSSVVSVLTLNTSTASGLTPATRLFVTKSIPVVKTKITFSKRYQPMQTQHYCRGSQVREETPLPPLIARTTPAELLLCEFLDGAIIRAKYMIHELNDTDLDEWHELWVKARQVFGDHIMDFGSHLHARWASSNNHK